MIILHQYHTLENERVLLRPLQLQDVEFLKPFSEHEPELWNFSLQTAAGKDNLIKYVQTALNAKDENKEYPFMVFDKVKNKYAGSTRYYDIQAANQSLQLGYTWYGKEFQGTGLNRNCKYLLLEFAFETLKVERVEFRADNNNEKSIAAMKSIGCKVDGILRSNVVKPNGERRDSIVLSILKNEWYGYVKGNLQKRL